MNGLRKSFTKLKLQINEEKSAVAPVGKRPFLGYIMYPRRKKDLAGLEASPESLKRIKARIRQMTSRGRSVQSVVDELAPRIRGWRQYLKLSTSTYSLRKIQKWMRHRLRAMLLKQWRTSRNIKRKLRGIGAAEKAIQWILSAYGRWWKVSGPLSHLALPNRFFRQLGLLQLAD